MAQRRAHLSRAPIAEAILDFRVKPRDDLQPAEFGVLAEKLRAVYPTQGRTTLGELDIAVGPDGMPATHVRGEVSGWLLRSEDGRVVQFRRDGYTFSKLRPYTSWEEIEPEAIAHWEEYCAIARPLALTRLAVRYINAMDLPRARLDRYLTAPPVAAPLTPQVLHEFLTRVVVWDLETEATAIITQALTAAAAEDQMRLLLDIDAFREGALPLDAAACSAGLGKLRELKNRIFFANLTETAVENFA